ncbi:hypothetical protein JCM17724A_21330 [Prevotella fusca JCM 17724]
MSWLPTLLSSSDAENLFMLILLKSDNDLKNHDIISGETRTNKGKNTYKKQVYNQQ